MRNYILETYLHAAIQLRWQSWSSNINTTKRAQMQNKIKEIEKKLLPVKNCRNIGKKDMVHNDATPKIEIDPETYEVKVDGEIATVDPATEVSLGRLYSLF